jgi:hypothetical protein
MVGGWPMSADAINEALRVLRRASLDQSSDAIPGLFATAEPDHAGDEYARRAWTAATFLASALIFLAAIIIGVL